MVIRVHSFQTNPHSNQTYQRFLKFVLIQYILPCFYSDVYSLCVAFPEPLADRLYNETKQFLENHVQNILSTQVVRSDTDIDSDDSENQTLLQRYYSAWMEYSQGIEYLNYLYL